jgi:hypothetical protein
MAIRRAVAAFGVLVGAALASPAQEPVPATTPTDNAFAAAFALARGAGVANVVPGSFRAQLVVDNRFPPKVRPPKGTPLKDEDRDPKDRTGKIHCLVCENGLSPVIAIFVRSDIKGLDATSGLGKLIKGADALIPKYRSDKLAAFAMFLKVDGGFKDVTVKKPDGSEDKVTAPKEYPDAELEKRETYVKEITDFSGALTADNVPMGLAPTSSPSVTAFGIGDMTPITVIVYNRMRMVQRWELKTDELTDAKIAEILDVAETAVTGIKKEPKKEPKEEKKD